MQPAPALERPAGVGEQLGLHALVDGDVDPGRGGSAGTGGPLELGQRSLDGVALADARHRGEGAQPDHEGQRLVDAEAQGTGDGVGVGHEDPAALPLGVDELVGHLAVAAHEQQLEVVLELSLADAEPGGGLGEVDPLTVHQPGHHREQPGEPVGRRLLHAPARGPSRAHALTPSWAAAAAVSLWTTASRTSAGPSTTTSGP